MIDRTVRGALVAVALLAIPVAPARACHLFDRCCGKPTTTYYQPYVANYAPSCCPQPQACCPQPQVVNYMPQTCYRTVYVNTPVTTFSPMTACDACGRATTVMRPVTTFVAQPRLVPMTTYRPVVTAMPAAQPCCGASAPATTTFSPAVQMAPAAPAAPACCTPASATTYSAAGATTYAPAPVTSPVPLGTSAPLQSVTPTPSLSPVPSPQSSQTFETSPSDIDATHSRLLLPPSSDSSNLISRPRGLDPENQDRTTAIPVRQPSVVRQASLVVPVKSAPVADDGWRAARP
jgi:hypothetical protein